MMKRAIIIVLVVALSAACQSPPPPKTAPPPPPPPLTRAPGGEPAIEFWNTWFENLANGNRVEELETGNIYSFVLDISRFSYFEKYSASVDPSVQKVVSDALERGDTKIRFTIRPILHGNTLRFTDKQPTSLALDVDLAKLLEPTDQAADEKMEGKKNEVLSGRMKLCDFAHEVQAGEVRFEVLAERAGDATISISIWDLSGMIPLDHLTLPVRVRDKKSPAAGSGPVGNTLPLKAGRATLLDVSSDFSSSGPLVADAAFYIFEPGPKEGNSIVLFAAKTGSTETGVPDGVSIYAWETETLLSYYIEGRGQLITQIEGARQRAKDRDENTRKYSYQAAADELKKRIFGGLDPEDRSQAGEAEQVFRDLVRRKDQASVVFVRMRNEKRNPVYLPLGILAASSESRFLDKRIILVQPLPRERYSAGGRSVEAWTFNVPDKLAKLANQSNTALSQLNTSPPYYRDISTVKGFFETTKPAAPDSSPEGVLLLAHQGGGNLWFTDDKIRIIREDIKRQFPPGSVGILSACSVAAAEGNNQAILEKLNVNGIDAMIISPFPVDADYGAMLAIHFVQAIEKTKVDSKGLSLAELFTVASQQTATYFREIRGINYEDMDLEFLIAGDYRIGIALK